MRGTLCSPLVQIKKLSKSTSAARGGTDLLNLLMNGLTYSIASTAASGGGGNPLQINIYTYIVQIISFLILVWILAKFAWKPLMNMMEKRRQFIADSIANAEKQRTEAARIKQEYQEELRKARLEAKNIIEKATRESEKRAAEILAQAHKENERLKQTALAEIEREREKAVAEIRMQVIDMSIAVAEKLLRRKLDMEGQQELIDQFIQEVGDRPC